MEIKFDLEEMAKLAENRDISVEKLAHEYMDEVFKKNPAMIWELEEAVSSNNDIFRCIVCGFWVPNEESASPRVCESCDEISGIAV